MNNEQLAKTIEATWVHLFKDRYYSDPTAQAQDQLMGRTHYVDPETLRHHHARVLRARPVCSGLLFRIIESAAADYQNTKRVYRYVVFDVWGEVVTRPELEDSFSSTDKALKAFDQWLAGFDLVDYYRVQLADRVKRTQAETDRLQTALDRVILTTMEEATA
jgi:hypothetical protein